MCMYMVACEHVHIINRSTSNILVYTCMTSRESLAGSEGEYYASGSRSLLDDVVVLSPLLTASVSACDYIFDMIDASQAPRMWQRHALGTTCMPHTHDRMTHS